ncbi:hypothetical protein ACTFIZ_011343 [Dictyostelium cf. discoideum]
MQEYKPSNLYTLPPTYKGPGIPSVTTTPDSSSSNGVVPKTFTSITIKNMNLKNRTVVSPMCMYSSEDGFMNDFHLGHYTSYARGGASLIVFEAAATLANGRISYADAGVYKDEHIAPMKRITDNIHLYNSYAGIQLAHAGRKASSNPPFLDNARFSIPESEDGKGWKTYGPSPIAFNENMSIPIEMTLDDIKEVIDSFRLAAERCEKAGFDFIEIHGAHGYLINQFLSPTSNKRTDQYGCGSFEDRCRFLFDIVRAIRSVWPTEKALGVRLSCEEWCEGGWTLDDTIRVAKILETMDVDIFDCSSGGNSMSQSITIGPCYQVPLAHAVKKATSKLSVACVGLINSGKEIEEILQQDRADLVFLARPFLRNPHFTYQVAHELNIKIDYNIHYNRGRFTNTAY